VEDGAARIFDRDPKYGDRPVTAATAAPPIPTTDRDLIGQCWAALVCPGDVHESRMPDTRKGPLRLFGVASGYFDDRDAFVAAASRASGADAAAVYVTLNPVNPVLLARAANRLRDGKPTTTADADILHRRNLLLDFDPVRPADISATDGERDEAVRSRDQAERCLREEFGWPDPVMSTMSGNGGGLIYRVDLPNDAEGTILVQRVVQGAAVLFGTARVAVDVTTYNAARVTKVVGTVSAKGDNVADRPWRLATATFNPEPSVVSRGLLAAIAAFAPKPEPRATPSSNGHAAGRAWDIRDVLTKKGIGFAKKDLPYATAYGLDHCLTSDDHTDGAAILEFPSGALAYRCHHNRCQGKGWEDVRSLLDLPQGGGTLRVGGKTVDEWRREHANGERDPDVPPDDDETGDADSGARPRLRFVTARAFAAQTPETTEWAVKPWVPVGGLTKIDGPPKRAGKTTLIVRMIAAAVDGADFLGEPTKRGPVILLTEQGGTSLREALAGAGLLDRDDLHLALYRDVAALAWPDVVADAFAFAAGIGAVLIVVDTLPACARVRGDDENSSGRALAAVEPLQLGADLHRIGVVLSFHDRKGGGEVGESGRGSSAYAGAVDVIVHLDRPGGNVAPTIRHLQALSRFEATPPELYIELTPTGYVVLGDADDVVRMQVAGALADALPATEEGAKPIAAVKRKGENGEEATEPGILDALAAGGVKAARSTVDEELKRWCEAGYAGRTGEGKRGSPYRYWLIARPPVAFFRLRPSPPSEESNAPAPDRPGEGDELSSDAHPPSEESNGEWVAFGGDHTDGDVSQESFLSSDAPDGYSGRNASNADEPWGDADEARI
jgi:AAA domain